MPSLIALILIKKLEGLFIYKYMVFSHPLFLPSQKICCTNSEEIDLHFHGKKFHSFYAFQLMIHFLAEESFLDVYSDDNLWNLTPGV